MHHAFWEMLSLAFSPFQDSGVAAGCPPYAGPAGGQGCSSEPADKTPALTQL